MGRSSLQHGLSLINNGHKHVLEFGVYRGETVRVIRAALDESFEVFGFDSFVGLPEPWVDMDGKQVAPRGHFHTQGYIPKIPGIKIYDGWFTDTLPEYLKIAKPITLLHVDSDLYSSAKEVLWALNDYIVEGTIMVFDEWFYCHDPKYNDHEEKAFKEWVAEFDREYEIIPFNDTTPAGEERKIVRILD